MNEKRYKIIKASCSTELEELVQAHFEENWELCGGVAVYKIGGSTKWAQAMANRFNEAEDKND
jgi:hypothetical protein